MFKIVIIIFMFLDFLHNWWLELYLKDLYKKIANEKFDVGKYI